MAVTAKEIADELGLSQPTVSRILNQVPGHKVSAATRKKVLDAARRMHYQPNAMARSLRHGRTDCMGFYSVSEKYNFDTLNEFYSAVVSGLQHACNKRNLDLILYASVRHLSSAEAVVKMNDGRTDGLFLHAANETELLAQLADSPMRVVGIANRLPEISSVVHDNTDGMRQVIDALWEKGYRRFAFLMPEIQHDSIEERREAFLQHLQTKGGELKEALIYPIQHEDPAGIINELRLSRTTPLAVCCWNDLTAYNLLNACIERGIEVPAQMAVTGFDGFLARRVPRYRLATVQCQWDVLTEQAMEIMKQKMEGQNVPLETIIPVSFVGGDTI